MVGGFPMIMWPLRADIIEVVLHLTGGKAVTTTAYYTITYSALLLIYATALVVQSAYEVRGWQNVLCVCVVVVWVGERDFRGGVVLAAWGI